MSSRSKNEKPDAAACQRCGKIGHVPRWCQARGKRLFPGRNYFTIALKKRDGSMLEVDGPMTDDEHQAMGEMLVRLLQRGRVGGLPE